jgi:hypothetical protein
MISKAIETIARAIAVDQFASAYFGNNASLGTIFQYKGSRSIPAGAGESLVVKLLSYKSIIQKSSILLKIKLHYRLLTHMPSISINSQGGSPKFFIPTPPVSFISLHTMTILPCGSASYQSARTSQALSLTPGFMRGERYTVGAISSIIEERNPR